MPAPATESDTLCVYKRPVRDTLRMYYKRSGIHPAGTHCPANGVAAGRGTLIAQGHWPAPRAPYLRPSVQHPPEEALELPLSHRTYF